MLARVVVIGLLAGIGVAHAEPTRSVALLPIRSQWTPPADVTATTEALVELGGELGVEVSPLDVDDASCWRVRACYIAAARQSSAAFAIGVELVKTSSGRLHVSVFLIDRERGIVRELGLVRTEPGALRARLRPLVAALRDAVPAPRSTPLPLPPVGEMAPLPPLPTLDEPAPPPWYQAISADAFVSVAFSHAFNASSSPIALRTFDTTSDAASLDVAELVIQRAVYNRGDAGFRLDLVAGSSIPHVTAAAGLFRDAMGKAGDFDLQQAYVSYIVPIGRGLRIDAGKYITPIGYEVIEGYDGYGDHYSHSFLFGYAIPFTHTGARAAYSFHDRFSVAAFGYNGWDVVTDNNSSLSTGAQVTVLPAADLTLTATYLGGRERSGGSSPWRHLGGLVASYKLAANALLALDVDAARDGDDRWYGLAGYARVDLTPALSTAVRGEWFADPQGARTGTAQRLWEATVTPALRVAPGVLLRVELRIDHSTAAIFPGDDGNRRYQVTAAANAIYAL